MLAFADALMSTVDAYGVKPDEYMSLECVKSALAENKLNLVSHWMAQNRCVSIAMLYNNQHDTYNDDI